MTKSKLPQHTDAPRKPLAAAIAASSALRSLIIVGDIWTLRILREAFRGTRRFSDWQRSLGIAKEVLSIRLSILVQTRVFHKVAPAGSSIANEYMLTEQGLDLWLVYIAFWLWETRWTRNPREQRLWMMHRTCGHECTPVPSCGHCGDVIDARTTEGIPVLGAKGQKRSLPRWLSQAEIATRSKRGGSSGQESAMIFGDRCNSGIIALAFRGTRRFCDFEEELGISPDTLSARLKFLVNLGVFEKHLYQTAPDLFEYRLTEKGRDLFPIVLQLMRWGTRWLTGKAGPTTIVMHKKCQHPVDFEFRCSACNGVLQRKDISLEFADKP